MPKVLIADSSEVFAGALRNAFQDFAEVHLCSDGTVALQLLGDLRPDILILTLHIHTLDGLAVLNQSAFRPPITVACANAMSDDVLLNATRLGISKVFLMPCSVAAIADYIKENCPSVG